MIYLIGGAARAGKTLVAHRLLQKHRVPYLCLDYVVGALDRGVPELGIDAEAPNEIRAYLVWPRIEPMLENIVLVEPAYTVEGDALLPAGVASLMLRYPGRIRACFLGYAATTPAAKLAEIRAHGGGVNDWIQKHDDGYILKLAAEMIRWSRIVAAACCDFDLTYIDVSRDFAQNVASAYHWLVHPEVLDTRSDTPDSTCQRRDRGRGKL